MRVAQYLQKLRYADFARNTGEDESLAEYTPQVIEHYEHPRNPGALPNATGTGQAGGGADGEILIQIQIRAEGDSITAACFRAFGCSASIASASVTTELLHGRPLRSALIMEAEEILDALDGLPADKRHCAEYAASAARAAVQDHLNRSDLA